MSKDGNDDIKRIIKECLEKKRKKGLARLKEKFNTDRIIKFLENAIRQIENDPEFVKSCEEKILSFKQATSQLYVKYPSREEISLTNIINDAVPLIKTDRPYLMQNPPPFRRR
ncbi:MAG: hypothetical protein ACTSYM_14065 [Candidatus Baldrarchaeia archaeon]